MAHTANDPFGARTAITTPQGEMHYYSLSALKKFGDVDRLPYSIKVLLESVLRNVDGRVYTEEHVKAIAASDPKRQSEEAFRAWLIWPQCAAQCSEWVATLIE